MEHMTPDQALGLLIIAASILIVLALASIGVGRSS